MKKLLLMMTMLITTMLLGVSGMALAGGPHDDCMMGEGFHHGFHDKQHRGERMFEALNLTDEQKKSIEQIHDQYRDQMKDQMRDRGPGYGDFMALDPEDPNYQDQVRQLARERADAVEQHILANAEKHAKIYAVLTEEQREKLKTLHEQRQEKFKERFKNRQQN